MPDADEEVARLLAAGRSALEAGEPSPATFVIPAGGRRWRVLSYDLATSGENEYGIPPLAFAHGAVGMLVASLGATRCYAAEPVRPGGRDQALVVTVFDPGRLAVHVQPFTRSGGGGLTWGSVAMRAAAEPSHLGAALPLWRAVNREPGPLPAPEGLIDDMVESGFDITVEEP